MFNLLKVEPDRSLSSEREFTWWPADLAQRVWVTLPRQADGEPSVAVHVETSLLRDVPDCEDALTAVGLLNQAASISALVWRQASRRIALHASVNVTEQTFRNNGFDDLAAMVAIHQADEAGRLAAPAARAIEAAEIDATPDPTSRPRTEPHPALRFRAIWQQLAQQPSHFAAFGGLQEVARILPWVDLHPSDDQVYGTLVYAGEGGAKRSAMLGVFLGHEHPAFGHGLHVAMYLPGPGSPEASELLNRLQAEHPSGVHGHGAWCIDDSLRYELFLPNAFAQPGLLESATLSMITRAEQAYRLFSVVQEARPSIVH